MSEKCIFMSIIHTVINFIHIISIGAESDGTIQMKDDMETEGYIRGQGINELIYLVAVETGFIILTFTDMELVIGNPYHF